MLGLLKKKVSIRPNRPAASQMIKNQNPKGSDQMVVAVMVTNIAFLCGELCRRLVFAGTRNGFFRNIHPKSPSIVK